MGADGVRVWPSQPELSVCCRLPSVSRRLYEEGVEVEGGLGCCFCKKKCLDAARAAPIIPFLG